MSELKNKTDALNWIKDFLNEVDTQDNRFTATPILFLLQTKQEYVAHDDYSIYGSKIVYRHPLMEGESCDTREDAIAWISECFDGDKKRIAKEVEKIEEFSIGHYWETQEVCFTQKGIERHLKLNKHNYGEHRDYVIHAFRNPEIDELFKALRLMVSEDNKNEQ